MIKISSASCSVLDILDLELTWTLQVRFFGFSDFKRHLIREVRYCKKETTLLIQENMGIFNKSGSLLSCSLDRSFEQVKDS